MANQSNKPIQKTISSSKNFSYQKGACALNFTLKTDVKTELKDFRECLVSGVEDIDKLLKEFPKK